MKLFYSPASPFVRKVLVLSIERGLPITCVAAKLDPVSPDADILARNPSGKIPTLIADDGMAIFDSRVIVEYLDGLPGGPRLLPSEPGARLRALVLQSLADELTDAAVLVRYETFLRPEPLRWNEWIAGQWLKVHGSLDLLEHEHVDALGGELHIGAIAVACALGYLDFRFGDTPWRPTRPRLAAWYAEFAERASMKATAPR
jgi:glutathione S-transferase